MIYLDNSATTFPKPPQVKNAVSSAVLKYGFNSGRGGYRQAVESANMIYSARENIGDMFGFSAENIAFMPNCTYALNSAIKGVSKKGGHIIISSLEHNAVARPVYALKKNGICDYDVAEFSYDSEKTVQNFRKAIKPNTTAIVCMHASNVFGCVFPIKEIGKLAHDNSLIFIVDAAQSAGVIDINKTRDNIDILCAPGHKGLYGPMGSGFIALSDNNNLNTIIEGGTGSESMKLEQPQYMPDMLESGTINNIGIFGLNAGVDFVRGKSIEKIYKHEISIISYIREELEKSGDAEFYTPGTEEIFSAPILSFNYKDYSSEKTASLLANKNIAVRAGYHCSMLAHTHFKTQDRGTVRVSPGAFTTYKDCEVFINTLKKI